RPAARAGIKHHQRVRVHLGTAERLGRLFLLTTSETIGPKQSAYCQVTVEEPLHVLRGDHFILRDETAQRTIAGGVVIQPWARRHKRTEAGLVDRLERLRPGAAGTIVDALDAFVDDDPEFALPIDRLCEFLNLQEPDLLAIVAGTRQ